MGVGVSAVCRCTFRRFSCELWVEAERVIWFACCGLEWGLKLSPVQFLHTNTFKIKMEHTLWSMRTGVRGRGAKPRPRLTPLQSPPWLGPANSILLALKHSHRAISAHTVRTGPLPRLPHTPTWLLRPGLVAASHQAKRL